MPKAIYTAAKGLIESNDSDSGFTISGAPLIIGTQTVELKQIKYTLDFTGVTTVNDVIDGGETTAYQNQTFVLYDGDANAITFEFNHALHDNGSGSGIAANAGAGTAIAIADGNTDEDIATAAATAISGYDSSGVFTVSRSTAELTIYVKKPGNIGDGLKDVVEAQSILDTITPGSTTASFTVDAQGALSRVAGFINADRGNNRAYPTANQIHGAGLSVVTLEQDDGTAAVEVAFANGSDVGQEKFIYNAASTGPIVLTGLFQDGATADGVSISLAAGAMEWCIWNGSRWFLALSVATMSS